MFVFVCVGSSVCVVIVGVGVFCFCVFVLLCCVVCVLFCVLCMPVRGVSPLRGFVCCMLSLMSLFVRAVVVDCLLFVFAFFGICFVGGSCGVAFEFFPPFATYQPTPC